MTSTFQATAFDFTPTAETAPAALLPRWLRTLLNVGRDPFADRGTGLFNRAGLFAEASRRMERTPGPVSAVVLEFSDWREVRNIYGSEVALQVAGKLVRSMRRLAGYKGLAGRTGPTQFTIVFVGVKPAKVLQRIERILGRPARVEFDSGDCEMVLVPEYVVDGVEHGAEGIQALYRDMDRDLQRIRRHEARRIVRLTAERERHSRPMPLRMARC